VKIDGGTRIRFISGPFHATEVMAWVMVCAKNVQAMYSLRK
jgi:hypothetical protein